MLFYLLLLFGGFGAEIDQGRELCWCDMCQDTCEPICFKFGLMLYATKLYSFIPVCMTLMFTQGYRVMGKNELL